MRAETEQMRSWRRVVGRGGALGGGGGGVGRGRQISDQVRMLLL